MKLKELILSNFKCFETLSVPLNEALTVIVGVNGVGKTTLLESAAIAMGTVFYAMEGIPRYGFKKTDAHNKYFSMGSVIDVQPQYPVAVAAIGEMNGKTITWKRTLNNAKGKTTVVDAKEMVTISETYQARMMHGDTLLILPLIAYYGTGRLSDYHREKKTDTFKKNNRANGYLDCLDGTANVKLMLNWFKKMAYSEAQSTAPSSEFKAVRNAIEKCFSLMTGIEEVSVQFNPDTTEIDISYSPSKVEVVKIPVNQLSDGYKGTLSLIADIAYRMAILNPWLSERVLTETDGVVLIDEIDLHLHPAWQQRILGDLRTIFPKVQFIVTTHAPAVINSVKKENLLIVNNDSVVKMMQQVYGKDVKSVLSEIMGVTDRPPEIANLFTDFYAKIAEKQYDEAENILNKIDQLRENRDPEVAACRVKLKLERIRGDRT